MFISRMPVSAARIVVDLKISIPFPLAILSMMVAPSEDCPRVNMPPIKFVLLYPMLKGVVPCSCLVQGVPWSVHTVVLMHQSPVLYLMFMLFCVSSKIACRKPELGRLML